MRVRHLRTIHHGSRCVLDRPSAFLSEDIGSVLKGGAKVCQRQLVNVVRPLVTEFTRNLGREVATPIQRGFNGSLLGRIQAILRRTLPTDPLSGPYEIRPPLMTKKPAKQLMPGR